MVKSEKLIFEKIKSDPNFFDRLTSIRGGLNDLESESTKIKYSSTYSWFSIFQVKNLAFNPAPLQSASELFNTIKIIQIGNIKIGSTKIRYNLYFHMQQQLPSLQYCHSKPNTAFSVAALWPCPNFNMLNLGNLLNGIDNICS